MAVIPIPPLKSIPVVMATMLLFALKATKFIPAVMDIP
jgi:hypothetical protein